MNNKTKLERRGKEGVAKFKKLAAEGLSIAALAAEFKMSESCVSKMKSNYGIKTLVLKAPPCDELKKLCEYHTHKEIAALLNVHRGKVGVWVSRCNKKSIKSKNNPSAT
jgi:transposase